MSARLEPQLLQAAGNNDVDSLRQIVTTAETQGRDINQPLELSLRRACEKGNVEATAFILGKGVSPNTRQRIPALHLAVEHNRIPIVRLLLQHGVNTETQDKQGRTALMLAAWKNHWHILNMVIAAGADVKAKDHKRRNVLHNLAADKDCDWGDDVVSLLLANDIQITGPEAKDELGRTPLHWAAATGKRSLAEMLLTRQNDAADTEAMEVRRKTSLHLAATFGHEDMVRLLLKHGALVNCKSDGGWMPLHNAVEKGHHEIVRLLLASGADFNASVAKGTTPLHLAAEYGHFFVAECLLKMKGIDMEARDSSGSTPLHLAAHNKWKNIVQLLAPFNQLGSLSELKLGACNGFSATIVSFGNFHNGNRVDRKSVYELLYGREPANSRRAAAIWPKHKATEFQWIHLPSNNLEWVQHLLTTSFIQEGSSDVEFLKSLEQTFSHQHRGTKTHSHFMRPLCQILPRSAVVEDNQPLGKPYDDPVITINGSPHDERQTPKIIPGNPNPPSRVSPGLVLFMPYLHYETDLRRQEMQNAITRAEDSYKGRPMTYDEMLIRAYLTTPSVRIHVRRTLDQCFFHNSDTRRRDQDQVVYRYQKKSDGPDSSDPTIIMVDQLWMWILDDKRIVTAFPQRWQQPEEEPLNLLNAIRDRINSRTAKPITSVYELATIITEKCASILDDHVSNPDKYQFFKMFESSIGIASDLEGTLFYEFNTASMQASRWLEKNRRMESNDNASTSEIETLTAVDKLLYIGQETSLLTETKDIRDELNMLSLVFNDQMKVLPDLQEVLCDIYLEMRHTTGDVRRWCGTEMRRIETRLKDLERMDRQTERIYRSVLDMLDLKQKHAANTNVFEARYAREQAQGTARQNQIIMVFTIVTIVFLPLSFIATFFTINIREFQQADGGNNLSLSYVSRWVFGVGFALSIPMVVVALNLSRFVKYFEKVKEKPRILEGKKKTGDESGDETHSTLVIPSSELIARYRKGKRDVEAAFDD